VTNSIGLGNRVTSDGTWNYRYDAEGNLIDKSTFAITSDNPTQPNGTTWIHYTYDNRNRLVKIENKVKPSGTTLTTTDTFSYDVLDRRVAKDHIPASGTATHERFVYDCDSDDVALVLDGSDFSSVKDRVMYAGGQVVAEDVKTGATVQTKWDVADHENSVRYIYLSGGGAPETVDYDAFGNVLTFTPGSRFGYAGYQRDAETGLYYCMARYYDPKLGRFISEDPAGAAGRRFINGTPWQQGIAEDAQKVFDEWRGGLERKVRSRNEHPAMESHLAKYRSLVPSLALLIHLADGGIGTVALLPLCKAISWSVYLESHARRIFADTVNSGPASARALSRKILDGTLRDGFSLRDVYRPHWSLLTTSNEAIVAVEFLIRLGWLKELSESTPGAPRTRYRINPKLAVRE
jgi:RHS repeat-associated protein